LWLEQRLVAKASSLVISVRNSRQYHQSQQAVGGGPTRYTPALVRCGPTPAHTRITLNA